MSLKINFIAEKQYEGTLPEPISASKEFPKWFVDIEDSPYKSKCPFGFKTSGNIYNLSYEPSTTIKNCFGIHDFLKTGYIIPSWSHFIVREDVDQSLYINWLESSYQNTYNTHSIDQFSKIKNPPLYNNFGKIISPWIIQTQKGVSCLITHPVWHRNKSFTTCTGILHTDQTPIHLPWIFEWNYKINSGMSIDDKDGFSVENQIIEKADPIILVIPFYRKDFESNVSYIESGEFRRLNQKQIHLTHNGVLRKSLYHIFRSKMGSLFK